MLVSDAMLMLMVQINGLCNLMGSEGGRDGGQETEIGGACAGEGERATRLVIGCRHFLF